MVWSDGQITLFPERRSNVEPAEPAPSTTRNLLPPPVPNKRTKAPPTPEAACMGGIEQVANYMLDHLKRLSESCLLAGNIKVLYYVLSSVLLIKCRVMTYKQVLKTPTTKALTSALNRCHEIIEIMTQHLLNYHSDIIRSSILQDSPSHDWCVERSYEENEKISLCIQMWSFYMQGIHSDLWRYTSPVVGETMFSNIFTDTLSLLVTRYLQVSCDCYGF
ncbi:UNVERIFIED_CONTAM: hypothetical protein GTU68_019903, partial [Idotea baltica]|nr:hypothetical protein [Idotea baltica]